MIGQTKRFLQISILVTFLASMALSCRLFGSEVTTHEETGYYSFNPRTILDDLSNNKNEIFVSHDEEPTRDNSTREQPVSWSVNDYLHIADSVNKYIWDESLENWQLNLIFADWSCEYYSNGPQYMRFRYFKTLKTDSETSRLVSEISIEPLGKIITWHKEEHEPVIMNWKTIELDEITVTLEDAVIIADESSGYDIRTSIDNQCSIYAILNPASSEYKGWSIVYRDEGLERLDVIYIDPLTGEVK